MGGSYILKDRSGKAAGYIQQVKGEIRFRVFKEDCSKGSVLIRFLDGYTKTYEAERSGREYSWPGYDKKLMSACWISDGECLAATEASLLNENTSTAGVVCKEQPSAPDQLLKCEKEETTVMPERRWPPPSCCAEAEYKNGRWVYSVDTSSD